MSKLTRTITRFLLNSPIGSEDLGRRATATKRAAGDIRRQGEWIAQCLSSRERETLLAAASILNAASEAARTAQVQSKAKEKKAEQRRVAAFKAVEEAFRDVTDAGGLIVMLDTSGSWRTAQKPDGSYLHGAALRESDFSYDAGEIQTRERSDALEHYAWRIATDSDRDVTAEATTLRAKFDQIRPAVEAKHPKLIQRLDEEMKGKI